MSRTHSSAALGFALGCVFLAGLACEEDGRTLPERCNDPALPQPYDILSAGAPADDNHKYNDHPDPNKPGSLLPPCITEVGHSISSVTTNTPTEGGDGSGGTTTTGGTAGKGSGGTKSSGGTAGKGSGGTAGKGSGGSLNLAGIAGVAGIGGK